MTIYLVKNENKKEVAAYTVYERAKYMAEYFQSLTFQRFIVEKIEVKVD